MKLVLVFYLQLLCNFFSFDWDQGSCQCGICGTVCITEMLVITPVVNFCNKTNQMHRFFKFISFWDKHCTCLGGSFRPSSGLNDCTHSNRHMPVAVCTVVKSWWWTERPSETCTVFIPKWNKFEKTGAPGGFYHRTILRCTALWMSNPYWSLNYLEDSSLLGQDAKSVTNTQVPKRSKAYSFVKWKM